MSTFVFTYRMPKGLTGGSPEGLAHWEAWFETMSDSIVDRGNPVFNRTTLGRSESDTHLGGYSIVTADDLEAAVSLAKGCPALQIGGGIEVGELTVLNEGRARAANN